jgi:hypothetical protein
MGVRFLKGTSPGLGFLGVHTERGWLSREEGTEKVLRLALEGGAGSEDLRAEARRAVGDANRSSRGWKAEQRVERRRRMRSWSRLHLYMFGRGRDAEAESRVGGGALRGVDEEAQGSARRLEREF